MKTTVGQLFVWQKCLQETKEAEQCVILQDREKYFWDVILTACVIGGLTVLAWRGLWVCLDCALYPDNAATSLWASVVIGYVLVLVAFVLQYPVAKLSRRLDRHPLLVKVLVEDAFHLAAFVGTLNVWRGCWMFLDHFVWPDHAVWKLWLVQNLSIGVLMLFLTGNSVIVRGSPVDGDLKNGEGVFLPSTYLETLMKAKQAWKRPRAEDQNANEIPFIEPKQQRV